MKAPSVYLAVWFIMLCSRKYWLHRAIIAPYIPAIESKMRNAETAFFIVGLNFIYLVTCLLKELLNLKSGTLCAGMVIAAFLHTPMWEIAFRV